MFNLCITYNVFSCVTKNIKEEFSIHLLRNKSYNFIIKRLTFYNKVKLIENYSFCFTINVLKIPLIRCFSLQNIEKKCIRCL